MKYFAATLSATIILLAIAMIFSARSRPASTIKLASAIQKLLMGPFLLCMALTIVGFLLRSTLAWLLDDRYAGAFDFEGALDIDDDDDDFLSNALAYFEQGLVLTYLWVFVSAALVLAVCAATKKYAKTLMP